MTHPQVLTEVLRKQYRDGSKVGKGGLWIGRGDGTGLHLQDCRLLYPVKRLRLLFVHGCAPIERVTQAGCCSKVESWMTTLGPGGNGEKNALRGDRTLPVLTRPNRE